MCLNINKHTLVTNLSQMLPCHQLIGSHDSHLHPTKKIKGNFLLPSEETTGKLLMIEFGELATQLNKKKKESIQL